MRRRSGKLLTPRPSPFTAWTAFVRRAFERLGNETKVAVIPTADAPPAKPPTRRKPGRTPKARRRVKG
jgi:hypothetical protein